MYALYTSAIEKYLEYSLGLQRIRDSLTQVIYFKIALEGINFLRIDLVLYSHRYKLVI